MHPKLPSGTRPGLSVHAWRVRACAPLCPPQARLGCQDSLMVGVQVLWGLRADMALGQAGPSSGAASPGGSCRPPLCRPRPCAWLSPVAPAAPSPQAPQHPSPLLSPVSCTLPRQAFFLGSRPVHPLPTGQAPLGVPPPRAPLQTHIQRDSWAPQRPLTPPGGHYLPLLPTSPLFHSDSPALDPWVLAEGAVPGDPPENPVLAKPSSPWA